MTLTSNTVDRTTVIPFVSVIARALYWAVGWQLDALEAATPIVPNDAQTGSSENGHALAVVVLSVLILESAINRVRHLTERAGNESERERKVNSVDYFSRLVSRRRLSDQVEELFALRDAIAHNHMYRGDFIADEAGSTLRLVTSWKLAPWSGDPRYRRVTNTDHYRTHLLRLNMVPTKVWRRDAYLALWTMFAALKRLEQVEPRLAITRYPFVLARNDAAGAASRLRRQLMSHETMVARLREKLKRLPRQRDGKKPAP
jgi:hypothetical protein